MKRPLVVLTLAVALAAAGGTAYAVSSAAPAKARTGAKIKLRSTKLGRVLVDSRGRTLYRFMKDTGRRSHCSGLCASNWPAVTTKGLPRGGSGVSTRQLGTTRRSGGVRQVTYHGHPLYTFVGDSRAGQTNGQGVSAFGARWYAVTASGARAGTTPKPSNTPPPYPGPGY
jgi:predicted lipoprotein with Yx(FWY)xxD motif